MSFKTDVYGASIDTITHEYKRPKIPRTKSCSSNYIANHFWFRIKSSRRYKGPELNTFHGPKKKTWFGFCLIGPSTTLSDFMIFRQSTVENEPLEPGNFRCKFYFYKFKSSRLYLPQCFTFIKNSGKIFQIIVHCYFL